MILEVSGLVRRVIHHCPDKSHHKHFSENMLPGDVLLEAPASAGAVYQFQKRFSEFSHLASRFSHVALYVGHGEIVHSMPTPSLDASLSGGVSKARLEDHLNTDTLYVVLRNPLVGEVHAAAIATSALNQIGIPYDYAGCIRAVGAVFRQRNILRKVRVGRPVPKNNKKERTSAEAGRALVCSDFVFVVFDEVFQSLNPCNVSGGRRYGLSTPSEFFENPNFMTVVI